MRDGKQRGNDGLIHTVKTVETVEELKEVLAMCYTMLPDGWSEDDVYGVEAWIKRMSERYLLVYAADEHGKPASAALGRAENADSVVLGFVFCRADCRRQGLTRACVERLEENARAHGYRCITLGSSDEAWGFYEVCGYRQVNEMHGQRIYQKVF